MIRTVALLQFYSLFCFLHEHHSTTFNSEFRIVNFFPAFPPHTEELFSFWLKCWIWKTWDRLGTFCVSPKSRRNCVWKISRDRTIRWSSSTFISHFPVCFFPSDELALVLVCWGVNVKAQRRWCEAKFIHEKLWEFVCKCDSRTQTAWPTSSSEVVLRLECDFHSQWNFIFVKHSDERANERAEGKESKVNLQVIKNQLNSEKKNWIFGCFVVPLICFASIHCRDINTVKSHSEESMNIKLEQNSG